jgi:hypothetical protein
VINIIIWIRDTGCYNDQISLAIDDKEKAEFITPFGIFCHTKKAFRLKNKGSTYQNGIHIILETQIRQNIEAYIDDVVVKSKKHGDLLDDLKVTFDNLRKYKIMLNHKKWVFYVSSGKLLSYMISALGELIPIHRRWRPSTNYNHLESEEKSRS